MTESASSQRQDKSMERSFHDRKKENQSRMTLPSTQVYKQSGIEHHSNIYQRGPMDQRKSNLGPKFRSEHFPKAENYNQSEHWDHNHHSAYGGEQPNKNIRNFESNTHNSRLENLYLNNTESAARKNILRKVGFVATGIFLIILVCGQLYRSSSESDYLPWIGIVGLITTYILIEFFTLYSSPSHPRNIQPQDRFQKRQVISDSQRGIANRPRAMVRQYDQQISQQEDFYRPELARSESSANGPISSRRRSGQNLSQESMSESIPNDNQGSQISGIRVNLTSEISSRRQGTSDQREMEHNICHALNAYFDKFKQQFNYLGSTYFENAYDFKIAIRDCPKQIKKDGMVIFLGMVKSWTLDDNNIDATQKEWDFISKVKQRVSKENNRTITRHDHNNEPIQEVRRQLSEEEAIYLQLREQLKSFGSKEKRICIVIENFVKQIQSQRDREGKILLIDDSKPDSFKWFPILISDGDYECHNQQNGVPIKIKLQKRDYCIPVWFSCKFQKIMFSRVRKQKKLSNQSSQYKSDQVQHHLKNHQKFSRQSSLGHKMGKKAAKSESPPKKDQKFKEVQKEHERKQKSQCPHINEPLSRNSEGESFSSQENQRKNQERDNYSEKRLSQLRQSSGISNNQYEEEQMDMNGSKRNSENGRRSSKMSSNRKARAYRRQISNNSGHTADVKPTDHPSNLINGCQNFFYNVNCEKIDACSCNRNHPVNQEKIGLVI